MLDHSCK